MGKVYETDAVYYNATEKAVLLDIDGEEIWVPKSQIRWPSAAQLDGLRRGDEASFGLSQWFARKEGLCE